MKKRKTGFPFKPFKKGDIVHIVLEMPKIKTTIKTCDTIKYFNFFGVILERTGLVHFNKVLFYACGYHIDGRVFILKKKYHYYIALCIEFIRLSPDKLKKLKKFIFQA